MGHSLGGAIALEMALARPDRIARACVISAAVYRVEPPLEGKLALMPLVGPLLFKRLYGKRDLLRVLRTVFFRDPRFATDETLDYFWDRLNRAGGRDAAYATLESIYLQEPLTTERLAALRCPVLVLWGDEDRAQPLASGRRLAREIPGAELRVIAAAGHLSQLERPREVLRHALPFFAPLAIAPAAHAPAPGKAFEKEPA